MNLLWLRSDLRVNDNIAIKKLLEQKINLKAFYLYDEDKFKDRSAQKWWLYKSLESLEKKLFNLDIKFEIFFEKELVFFDKFIKKNKINKIFWNTIDLPDEKRIENQIISLFKKNNIEFNTFSSNLLQKPEETVKKDGTPFQVFTPFWKNAEEKYVNSKNYSPIETGKVKNKVFKSENIKKIQKILPNKKWYLKFDKYWIPGEDIAENKIKSFLKEKINNYHNTRDIPSIEGTSKISPYLAFGEITSKNIFYQSSKLKDKKTGYRKYINEIGWREFSYHLINHFPKMKNKNLRENFDNFPWSENKTHLKKWKKGETGYPIVDAAMKELYETGWMHNRLRMVVGSFLVKHLRIHWIEGEKYFKDTLLDYDLANNIAGWQWIAGCGADAAPYFRIFNPMIQGEKFDPDGIFVKKWLPNLKNIPKKYIHRPWEMPKEISEEIGFNLNKDYFAPIVDHQQARESALRAFESIKK